MLYDVSLYAIIMPLCYYVISNLGECVILQTYCFQYRNKKNALSISKVTQTMIPPKDVVQYNKETQTPKESAEKEC